MIMVKITLIHCREYAEDPAICDSTGEPKGQCRRCGNKWYEHPLDVIPRGPDQDSAKQIQTERGVKMPAKLAAILEKFPDAKFRPYNTCNDWCFDGIYGSCVERPDGRLAIVGRVSTRHQGTFPTVTTPLYKDARGINITKEEFEK